VASLLEPDVVSIDSESTVSEVAKVMAQKNVRNVFVMTKGEPCGLIRDWDIISRVVALNLDPDKVKTNEIMYKPVAIVKADAELSEIAAVMAETGVRRVLVMQESKILGTITAGNLLSMVSHFPKSSLRETLRSIAGLT
jgi:predicted transcriptional regulator